MYGQRDESAVGADSTSIPIERLGDAPIDEVPTAVGSEPPDYRELYYEWERRQWAAGTIDLADDRRWWRDEMPGDLRGSFLWVVAPFYVGKEQAVAALVPFVDAAPTEEHQVFLTTQLVDAARHAVLFDRFYAEVVDESGNEMEERLGRQTDRLNSGCRTLLLEMLPGAAERIRSDPQDLERLVYGVFLYHIVIEGTLALTGQRFLLDLARERNLLPGFRGGLTAIARDTAHHVSFGVSFLREMVAEDDRYARVIRAGIEDVAPVAMSSLDRPPGEDPYGPLPYGPSDLAALAMDSLRTRLGLIGIDRGTWSR